MVNIPEIPILKAIGTPNTSKTTKLTTKIKIPIKSIFF
jgi:hypothetical protein